MILAEKISHQYDVWQGDEKFKRTALDTVSLDVKSGEFLAILGANGSGKSTLAKHLNVLLLPDEGTVFIDGKDTADAQNVWDIRTTVGMVFQNPDNQIVGTSVEEDVAFGPENRNMKPETIREKVTNGLAAVGLLSERKTSPYRLSGGQKQRVAVAGVLASDSKCIVLDEPTAMLDPVSRRELMNVIRELHDKGKTIILITHHTDEAVFADHIILMDSGHIVAGGAPNEIFADPELLKSVRMEMPPVALLAEKLRELNVLDREERPLTKEELVALLRNRINTSDSYRNEEEAGNSVHSETIMSITDLKYTYSKGTINESSVLKGVSFDIHKGECIGLIGASGAGKTTLAKNLNGLLKADSGDVIYMGESIYRRGYKLSELRKKVGLVFQNSETQLFCKTVLDDVSFGPRKMGMSDEEARQSSLRALSLCDIGEEYYGISPMDLSGGQKRRVALAGVLAMNPSVLVLDEPAAGLDPGMKAEIFGILDRIRKEEGTAIVLISHEMEDIAEYADKVLLLSDGEIKLAGSPQEVFSEVDKVRAFGADVPAVTDVMYEIQRSGHRFGRLETRIKDAAHAIAMAAGKGGA